MSTPRRLGLFLVVIGVLTVAASGYLWRGGAARRAEISAEKVMLEDSVRRVHETIVQTNLKYRAFQASLPTMPDTVQKYGGAEVMEIGQGYSKTLRRLETQERDLKLDVQALVRAGAKEHAKARATALPVAAAGAGATIIGIILTAVSRRRVVA
jgi:hypothetical protein